MLAQHPADPLARFRPGDEVGVSDWVVINQAMIDGFGTVTLDPDPMHVDPDWAREKGPFGGAIAFGFLTISLLTRLMHGAMGGSSDREPSVAGYFLNYGFNRLRLVAPVPVDSRVRGRFALKQRIVDEKGRLLSEVIATIEIEGSDRPALVAEWLSMWVPPDADA